MFLYFLGRSPGEGKGYPLQYSDLEDSMDCIVHGLTESLTLLSDFHFHLFYSKFLRFGLIPESLDMGLFVYGVI